MKNIGLGFVSRKLGAFGALLTVVPFMPPELWQAAIGLCGAGAVYVWVQGRIDVKKLEVEWARYVTGQAGKVPKQGAEIHPFQPPDATG
jgi:hypothetical protein